jgi:hypothetical protein
MKIAVLQQYLRSLAAPLAASGASPKVTTDLEKTSAALERFKDQDLAQLAVLLDQAEAYYSAASRPPDPAKIRQMAQQVRHLEEKAASTDVSREALVVELQQLGLHQLNKLEALSVARELGAQTNAKTTSEQAFQFIHQSVLDREEFRRTGIDPNPKAKSRVRGSAGAKAVDPAKIQRLVQQIRHLEEKVGHDGSTLEGLGAELDQLSLGKLKKDELLTVARELDLEPSSKSTVGALVELIRRSVLEQKKRLDSLNV